MKVPEYAKSFYWKQILDAQDKYGIGWELIAAVILTESSGNQYAYRYEPNFKWIHDTNRLQNLWKCTNETALVMQKSSYGLMQIMGATAIDLGLLNIEFPFKWPTLLYDINYNLEFGCKLLRQKIDKYGHNMDDIYAAYNAGEVKKKDNIYQNEWAVIKFRKFYRDMKGEGDVKMTKLYGGMI